MPSCLDPVRASESQEPLAGGSSPTLEANNVGTCVLVCMSPWCPARADLKRTQPSILAAWFARVSGHFLWLSAYIVVMLFIISVFMPSKALEQKAKRSL